jgi:alkylation response protein AidB-like acyl-CoA dehydrogenase
MTATRIGRAVQRELFDEEHEMLRSSFRQFLDKEVVPRAEGWDRAGIVDRELFRSAGQHGFLGVEVPEEHGGGGVADFRYSAVMAEEIQYAGVNGAGAGLILHSATCLPYLLALANDEQRRRWLPGVCSGELILAIAMTEPGTGSDLAAITTTAVSSGDDYVVNGSKTFISNGINADLVITAVKTGPGKGHRGLTLLVVERGMAGFERGRNLDKVGMHAQDTSELFFNDVRIPVANRLGAEGGGFRALVTQLPKERLIIAVTAVAAARAALDWTLAYCQERTAFGQPIGSFQNSRFKLAEMATEVEIAQVFVDRCVRLLGRGDLTAAEAAMAKWWCTELQGRVVDTCVQLHGGYGYMTEYPVARAYADARIMRIFGGTNEIMKELIGRSLGV